MATPAERTRGEDVIVASNVSDEEAPQRYPGFIAKKPYLRGTPQPHL